MTSENKFFDLSGKKRKAVIHPWIPLPLILSLWSFSFHTLVHSLCFIFFLVELVDMLRVEKTGIFFNKDGLIQIISVCFYKAEYNGHLYLLSTYSYCIEQCFSNFRVYRNHLTISLKCRLWLSRSGDPKFCFSNKFPGGALGTTL